MGEDHFSGTAVTDDLKRPTRDSDGAGHPSSLFGLAPGGVCRATSVTGRPVRSYRTLSPLPVPHREAGPSAVCSLLHFPSPHGARALPGTLPCGARTFLRRSRTARAVAPRRSSLTCSLEATPWQNAGSQKHQWASASRTSCCFRRTAGTGRSPDARPPGRREASRGAHPTPRPVGFLRTARRPVASLPLDRARAPPSSPKPRRGSPRPGSYCAPSCTLATRMRTGGFGGNGVLP